MSSDVEISESFLGDVAFDDVAQLVIKKLVDDLWATVEFNLKKQPTQFFYQTPAWLEGKEKAHLGVKKTRSHEIMMNRAGLKDSSFGGADRGGSSTEHTPKKLNS